MPWTDQTFSNDQLKRRLAFLIHRRCNELGIGYIAKITGINRDTVRSYGEMKFEEGDGKGPVNLTRVKSILDTTGDRWSTVMWAVEHSTDKDSFMEMLTADTTVQLREDTNRTIKSAKPSNYTLQVDSYRHVFKHRYQR
jgi:hypothetical protein